MEQLQQIVESMLLFNKFRENLIINFEITSGMKQVVSESVTQNQQPQQQQQPQPKQQQNKQTNNTDNRSSSPKTNLKDQQLQQRRMSKPKEQTVEHSVLSNIENKEIKPTKSESNHYIKNKNLQSPVNRNKVINFAILRSFFFYNL